MGEEKIFRQHDSIWPVFNFWNIGHVVFQKRDFRKNARGFTLVELVIVVGVLATLISVLLFLMDPLTQFKKARDGKRKSDLQQVQASLELYRADQGSYPAGASYASLTNCPTSGPTSFGYPPACTTIYQKAVPQDPTNSGEYVYQYCQTGNIYVLRGCLENTNDSQKDATINGAITGCTFSNCTQASFTLQSP